MLNYQHQSHQRVSMSRHYEESETATAKTKKYAGQHLHDIDYISDI